jgi:excinuclease UvrABC ATPase subunit
MVDQILARPEGEKLMLLAPVVSARKGEYHHLLGELNAQGFVRARIDGDLYELDDPPTLDAQEEARHRGRGRPLPRPPDLHLRLAESIETALKLSGGILRVASMDADERRPRPSPPPSPARSAATASRSWNRGCSRSTTRPAPARPATGSASSSSSTRPRWSPSRH